MALKPKDKVKVKDGEELEASHKGALGTITSVSVDGDTIGVTFAGVEGTHSYGVDQLVKQ